MEEVECGKKVKLYHSALFPKGLGAQQRLRVVRVYLVKEWLEEGRLRVEEGELC